MLCVSVRSQTGTSKYELTEEAIMPNKLLFYILWAVVGLLIIAVIFNSLSINALTDMFTDQADINRSILDMFREILR